MTHTDACRYARTACRAGVSEVRTDYPWLSAVRSAHGQEGVDAVMACPSPEHDAVRFIVIGRWRP